MQNVTYFALNIVNWAFSNYQYCYYDENHYQENYLVLQYPNRDRKNVVIFMINRNVVIYRKK